MVDQASKPHRVSTTNWAIGFSFTPEMSIYGSSLNPLALATALAFELPYIKSTN